MIPSTRIFDGHNDVLTRLYKNGGIETAGEFVAGQKGHIDLPKAKKATSAVVFLPSGFRRPTRRMTTSMR